jgi:hypothetical protein
VLGVESVDWHFFGWEVKPWRRDLVEGEVQGSSGVIKIECGQEGGQQEEGRISRSCCANGGALGLYDLGWLIMEKEDRMPCISTSVTDMRGCCIAIQNLVIGVIDSS